MGKKSISQEGLKLIACITMLVDHFGAAVMPAMELRIIGRIAFPIYCFLLAEGIDHTKNPKRYGLRLLAGAALAEIPFDLLFFGQVTLRHQSVMVTLLIGFLMAVWIRKKGRFCLPLAVAFFAAELLQADYGGTGVALIALFLYSRKMEKPLLVQAVGMAGLMLLMGSVEVTIGIVDVPVQMFALLSLIPIGLYTGEKTTGSVWIQRVFYLFYPVHMMILYFIVK